MVDHVFRHSRHHRLVGAWRCRTPIQRGVVVFLVALIVVGAGMLGPVVLVAQEESESTTSSTEDESGTDGLNMDDIEEQVNNSTEKQELERVKEQLQEKLNETLTEKENLSGRKQTIDVRRYLAEEEYKQKQKSLKTLVKQYNELNRRTNQVEVSLASLGESLVDHVRYNYMQPQPTFFDIVLDSEDVGEAMHNLTYLRRAQEKNEKVILQAQEIKLNYEKQRERQEKLMEEIRHTQSELVAYKQILDEESVVVSSDLAKTEEEEEKYRQLIAETQERINQMKEFTQSLGLDTIPAGSLGAGEGGWYLSQRDERWASVNMGDSPETVLDVGCLITSVSMIMRQKGIDFTPPTIANDPRYFSGGTQSICFPHGPPTAYACYRTNYTWPNGLVNRQISWDEVDEQLKKGNPVLAGVYGPHYVVLKAKQGDDYIMNDPLYGPDLLLSDYYSLTGEFEIFE